MRTIQKILYTTASVLVYPFTKIGHICCSNQVESQTSNIPSSSVSNRSKPINRSKSQQPRQIRQRKAQLQINPNEFPGIYVVKYSEDSIKIGRSKQVLKRLQGYKGYQSHGQDIEVLLLIRTFSHKELEKKLHLYAQESGLPRLGKLEIFQCQNQSQFIQQLRNHVVQITTSKNTDYTIIEPNELTELKKSQLQSHNWQVVE